MAGYLNWSRATKRPGVFLIEWNGMEESHIAWDAWGWQTLLG